MKINGFALAAQNYHSEKKTACNKNTSNHYANIPLYKNSTAAFGHHLQVSNFDEFMAEFRKKFPKNPIPEIVQKSIKKDNCIGVGGNGAVYKIDDMDGYVVKIPRGFEGAILSDFKAERDCFPHQNYGQAIASNSQRAEIMKRVKGTPGGLNLRHIISDDIPKEEAMKFYAHIEDISKYPEKSYIDFANEVKQLNGSGRFFADSINSDNLLIDTTNKKFNLIDLMDKQNVPGLESCTGDVYSMINLCLEGIGHTAALRQLPPEQQKKMIEMSKIIIEKCKSAAKKAGLKDSHVDPRTYLVTSVKFRLFAEPPKERITMFENFDAFMTLYKDVLPPVPKETKMSHSDLVSYLGRQFKTQSKIIPHYLSFYHHLERLSKEDLLYFLKLYPEKISAEDVAYIRKMSDV